MWLKKTLATLGPEIIGPVEWPRTPGPAHLWISYRNIFSQTGEISISENAEI